MIIPNKILKRGNCSIHSVIFSKYVIRIYYFNTLVYITSAMIKKKPFLALIINVFL